ncbi:MAG: hypothetical protein QOE97_2273 [Pseudonocardiales bacterium]|jgi:hypothetical protein|nr:hypothetical protein [Pseudonocardiales bacterium]
MSDVHEPRFSPEARARAERTIEVAAVFAANADAILAAMPDVPPGHVLVGIVDADHAFAGTHHVETESMVTRVPELEAGGWAMVFPQGTVRDDIVRRTVELAEINRQRIAAIDRIVARRASRDGG